MITTAVGAGAPGAPGGRALRRRTPVMPLAVLGVVVAGYAMWTAPSVAVPLVVLPAVVLSVVRIGAIATAVVGAVMCLTFSAFLARYVPAAATLNQVGVVLLMGSAIVVAPRLHLPKSVRYPGTIFVVLATGTGVLAVSRSTEYGLKAWIALVCAPAAAVAGGGLLGEGVLPAGQRARARGWVIGAVVLAIVANILLALRQALFGLTGAEVRSAVSGASTYKVGDQIRLMGTFQANQEFGVFVACMSPALLVYAVREHGRRRRIAGTLALLMYSVTFLSLTRTALIASIVAGVLGLVVWGRGSIPIRAMRLVFVALAMVGILFAALSQISSPRIHDSVDRAITIFNLSSDSSFKSRTGSTLPYSFGVFEQHPFGLGAGSAGPISQQFPDIAPLGNVTTDNAYLMIAIQLGFLGVAAFVWMLVALAAHLRRAVSPVASAASTAIGSLLIAMVIAGYWSLLGPIGIIGVVVGIGIADSASERRRQTTPSPSIELHTPLTSPQLAQRRPGPAGGRGR